MNGVEVRQKKVLQTGTSGGFSAELFVGIPKMLEVLATDFGMLLFVHGEDTSPLSIEPITVSPNTEANVVVSVARIQNQPKPYSGCQELDKVKSELKDLILTKGSKIISLLFDYEYNN